MIINKYAYTVSVGFKREINLHERELPCIDDKKEMHGSLMFSLDTENQMKDFKIVFQSRQCYLIAYQYTRKMTYYSFNLIKL